MSFVEDASIAFVTLRFTVYGIKPWGYMQI